MNALLDLHIGLFIFLLFSFILGLSFVVSWLIWNWFLPYTKIEKNGLKYRVLQLNLFRIWQVQSIHSELKYAIMSAEGHVKDWHERNDKYIPIEKSDLVAEMLERNK